MSAFSRIIAALVVTVSVAPAPIQGQAVAQAPSSPSQPATPGEGRLTPSELEDLLESIALYPDALLANMLAAAVYPDEVAEAAKSVAGGAKPEEIAGAPWEEPVKAVAKVQEAIKTMGDYPEWTTALGQAYLTQAKDVMDVVQSLRKKAHENGALKTTPEQQIVVEQETIIIQSPDPEVIYVPSYSPTVVYADDPGDEIVAGAIGFGVGILVGAALSDLDCNWYGGNVGWGYHGNNDVDININGDVNIGNDVNVGNRVGNEGNAWAPNNSKSLATSKPNQTRQFQTANAGAQRPATPTRSTSATAAGARPAATPSARPAAAPSTRPAATPSARPSTRPAAMPSTRPPSRVPPTPTGQSAGAFSGGRQTQVQSDRGARSRQSAAGSGTRSTPSRSGGGRRAR